MNDGPPTPPPEPVREPVSLSSHDGIRASTVGSSRTSQSASLSPTRGNGRGLKSRGLASSRSSSRESKEPPKNGTTTQQQNKPDVMDAAVSAANTPHTTKQSQNEESKRQPSVGGAPQGKMRASVAASRPGAVSVTEPASVEPGARTGVGGAPQGKMRRANTVPSQPGAVSSVEPTGGSYAAVASRPGAMSVVEPNTGGRGTGVGGAPSGKMRASVPAASRPGAMSVTGPAVSEPGAITGVGGAPQGKMKRATAHAEVRSAAEPEAKGPDAHVATQFNSSMASMNSCELENSFSSLNGHSSHMQSKGSRGSRNGSSHGLRGSNHHRRGLKKNTTEQSDKPSDKPSDVETDPQSIRRKQIQEIMKDPNLNQQEKQAQIQHLMAGGMPMPKPQPALVPPSEGSNEEEPESIRRKQIQEIMKDATMSQSEKQTKIQHLMAGGMPKPAASSSEVPQTAAEGTNQGGENPQTIRRKQIQEIMKDSNLTQPEKQAKIQELMASGMPKAGTPSVSSTHDTSDSSVEPHNFPSEISGPSEDTRENSVDLAAQEDEEARRQNQEIMEIMMDPTLTAREKQLKTQEVLVNGVLSLSGHLQSNHSRRSEEQNRNRSVSPFAQERRGPRGLGIRRSNTGGSQASGKSARSAGLRRARTSDFAGLRRSSHSPARDRGLHRARNADASSSHSAHRGSTHSTGRGLRKSAGSGSYGSSHSSNAGARRMADQELVLGGGSNHSEVSMDSFHDDDSDGVEMYENDGSENGDAEKSASAAKEENRASDVHEFATPAGVGGAPQGKMRRTAGAASKPGAVSVSSSSDEPNGEGATVVGGAPQGKMRRTTGAAASKPGAVSVVEPSSTNSEPRAATGVGGAPQGKMRRTAGASEVRPGAVGVTPAPSEPGAKTGGGVGGAPQGKFRGTVQASAPGAVSVVDRSPGPSEPGTAAGTGVGGAPQGKFKRSAKSQAKATGAVGVMERTEPPAMLARAEAPREPSNVPSKPGAATGVGGAPQGKFRKAGPAASVPGAVNVEEPTAPATTLARSKTDAPREPAAPPTMLARAHTTATSEPIAHIEKDMLAKSNVRRSRPAHVRPGAQTVENSTSKEPDDNAAPSPGGDLPPSQAQGSTEDGDFNHAVKMVEDDLAIKMRARADAQNAINSRPQAPPLPSSPSQSSVKGAEDDFNHAVQLVEDDLQAKMRARAEAQMGTSAGANRDDYEDVEMQKEKEKEAYRSDPASTQSRMQQKILQMEQEHRARDDKLEELDRMEPRARVSQNFKDPSSPMSDVFNDESESVENGFLNPDPEAIRRAEEDGLAIATAVEEDDEPDVYDVELKMYDPKSKPPFHKNRRFRCYATLICLLTVAAIVMTAVMTARKAGEVILITQAPSASPSAAPTTTRATAVRGELARVIGDIVNAQAGTPYDQAMDWILYEDPLQLTEFSENLIQRYTLALFYFQTSDGGEKPWISCNPPNPDLGENYTCPFYEFYRPENTMEKPTWVLRNETSVRWLSEKHECQWAEVLCHPTDNGDVIGIDIRGQNLTGTLPEDIRHLKDLMWLSLSQNLFTGTIPEVYGEFPYLTIFEVVETLLTGEIPSGFFTQSNLLQFNPAFTMLTGTIPTEIGQLTALHSLFWFGTEITGTLPTGMGLMEDIRNIWMWDNPGLSGTIPSELGQLSLLEELKLGNNGHEGPLPSELGLLTNMEELLLAGSNMNFTAIPEELWNMTNVLAIDFNDAGFGGTLSTRIGQLTNLYGFKASRNYFTGTIPSEIGLLSDLQLLWVHVNENLTGEVPIEICYLQGPENLQFLNADCGGSSPRVSCICCTGCCDEFGQCQRQ